MSQTIQVIMNSNFYNCLILNNEMAESINTCKLEILTLNANLNEK